MTITKTERVRRARLARSHLGHFILFQEKYIRDAYPESDQLDMRYLLEAREQVSELIVLLGGEQQGETE